MRILMVNKFLYPKGGAEIYMLKLGDCLMKMGNQVQYFGMYDKNNTVGNDLDCYTEHLEFGDDSMSLTEKLRQAKQIIYSKEAYKKMEMLIRVFEPDVIHLNNINYQLTPSVIYAASRNSIPIIQTVHDAQIACPNHRMYIEHKMEICEKCITGSFIHCVKERCVQNSLLKSTLAMTESIYYHRRNTYNLVDTYICPSKFIGSRIVRGGVKEEKIVIMHNFSESVSKIADRQIQTRYVLYFGRLSIEKGIHTLIEVGRDLPHISFVFAGKGPLEDIVQNCNNIFCRGFVEGMELSSLIRNAEFTVYPSECHENCPLSIVESQSYGTPVIASFTGGIPELIEDGKTGVLFKAGNKKELKEKIEDLWNDRETLETMRKNCLQAEKNNIEIYAEKVMHLYRQVQRN